MLPHWAYDIIYRFGAPWEIGPRSELVELVETGRLTPESCPRAIDLGCGSGANPMFLAERGWADVTGVDFLPIALRKAQRESQRRGLKIRWVRGDLARSEPPAGYATSFDLLVDYGTLDDLSGKSRVAMARLITALAAPGARFVFFCFYADPGDLPRMSFDGPSKTYPGITPGEEKELFAADWEIERLDEPEPGSREACFLMVRRG